MKLGTSSSRDPSVGSAGETSTGSGGGHGLAGLAEGVEVECRFAPGASLVGVVIIAVFDSGGDGGAQFGGGVEVHSQFTDEARGFGDGVARHVDESECLAAGTGEGEGLDTLHADIGG